jgi:glycosyltransferase involved in cell wall biosynthesis
MGPRSFARLFALVLSAFALLLLRETPRLPRFRDSGSPRREFGVNFYSWARAEFGLGETGRSLVRALIAAKIPVSLRDGNELVAIPRHVHRDKHVARLVDEGGRLAVPVWDSELAAETPYLFNIFAIGPDLVVQFLRELRNATGDERFQDLFVKRRYNIGYWFWEMEQFPASWNNSFSSVNEIWAASNFVAQIFREAQSFVPIVRVNPSLPELYLPDHLAHNDATSLLRLSFGFWENEFIFFFNFDCFSRSTRKNPQGVIEAFLRAFDRPLDIPTAFERRSPRLLVKYLHCKDPFRASLHAMARNDSRISIYDFHMEEDKLVSLLRSIDAYVSLHRSEGLGLGLIQAMMLGKPVVATNYSGNLDFMTEESSYLVKADKKVNDVHWPPYDAGFVWSEPDVDSAAAILRRVIERQDEARTKAARAQRWLLDMYSKKRAALVLEQRLEAIWLRETEN